MDLWCSRSNIATFEERFHRLRKEMDQIREERTRLSVSLDFSKDERNHLTKQLKEMEEKLGMFYWFSYHNNKFE